MQKTFAVAIAFCLALVAGGALAAEEPAAIAERCAAAMEKADSFAVKGTMTYGIEGVLHVATDDALTAEVRIHPFKAHVLFAWKDWKMETYFQEPMEWPALPEDLRVEAAELADGAKVWRLSADFNLRGLVSDAGIEEAVQRVLGPSAGGVYPGYEPVTARVSAFVDVRDDTLRRVEIDLSDFLSDLLNRTMPTQPGMESEALVGRMTLALDLMDLNAAPDFEIPAEVQAR